MRASSIPDVSRIDGFKALFDPARSDAVIGATNNGSQRRYSDRASSATETFARVSPLLARYGITRVARQTGLDRVGIPVWSAMRPNSLSLAVNQGKGIDDDDARISAVMEALERAVAGAPEIASRLASRAEMGAAGHNTDCLKSLIATKQQPLAPSDVVAWVEGYDLIASQAVWVPRDAVMLDRTVQTCFWQSSDGLASGNTPLEAVFHGLLERVERDAEALWSLTKPTERAARCIDPAQLNDPVIDMLVSKIRRAGLQLQVFDTTSDIGLACFHALIGPGDLGNRQSTLYVEAANGSGCHLDPVRALIRAVSEAAQSRLTLVSGSRDDVTAEIYLQPMPESLFEDFSHRPSPAPQPYARYGLPPALSLHDSLFRVLDALKQKAIHSVIAVPLNPLDAEFSVVKMLVPGLENPPGDRKARFGARAFTKIVRSR